MMNAANGQTSGSTVVQGDSFGLVAAEPTQISHDPFAVVVQVGDAVLTSDVEPNASGSVGRVRLAGTSVPEHNVADLARLLFAAGLEETGDALLVALDAEQDIVALSIADREAILRVLDDPPTNGLAELRGVLLPEHEGRLRDGLV